MLSCVDAGGDVTLRYTVSLTGLLRATDNAASPAQDETLADSKLDRYTVRFVPIAFLRRCI